MKNIDELHLDILGYSSLNMFEKAINIINYNRDKIDVMYNGGALFDFTMAKKNLPMLQILLELADEKKVNKFELRKVIRNADETYSITSEMHDELNKFDPYILAEDEESDQELPDIDEVSLDDNDEGLDQASSNGIALTEEHLAQHNQNYSFEASHGSSLPFTAQVLTTPNPDAGLTGALHILEDSH